MALPSDPESVKERVAIVAEAWLNGASKTEAYRQGGFSSVTPGNAATFFKNHKDEIDAFVFTRMKDTIPKALKVLEDIMLHGKSETARMKAITELLDRAGFTTISRIEITNGDVTKLQNDQLEKELQELLEKSGRLKLVGGTDAKVS
jgi:hypothetical protein